MRLLIILLSLLLASCSEMAMPKLISFSAYKVPVRQGNLVTQDMLGQVKLGMPETQVRAILGSPLVEDPFHAGRWDYLYSLKETGKLQDQQRLTLYFKDDRLVRIDDSGMLAAGYAGAGKEK